MPKRLAAAAAAAAGYHHHSGMNHNTTNNNHGSNKNHKSSFWTLLLLRGLSNVRKRKLCFFFFFCLCLVWCIVSLLTTTRRQQQQQQRDDVWLQSNNNMIPSSFEEDITTTRLVFLISMGQQAMESKLVERFVWSARHRGEWKGWIVLLTDAPKQRYNNNITKDEKKKKNSMMMMEDYVDEKWIVMNPLAEHFNTSFHEDMPYKRFKTYILEYVNQDSRLDAIQLIYYLDVDIIVGNSLPLFFYQIETLYNIIPQTVTETPPSSSKKFATTTTGVETVARIWFFQNKYQHMSVQGGQFILDRKTSQPCLSLWRNLIDSNVTEVKDQPALHQMRVQQQQQQHSPSTTTPSSSSSSTLRNNKNNHNHNQQCQIVTMEWKRFLYFPSNSTVFKAVHQIQKHKNITLSTLIHFKNSCNTTSQINEDVENIYIEYILQNNNKELANKIHVQPDDSSSSKSSIGATMQKKQHVVADDGTLYLQ